MSDDSFVSFSLSHFSPILVISIITIATILYARRQNSYKQRIIGLALSMVVLCCVILRMAMCAYHDTFTLKDELPFHLCRTLALVMPFFMWNKNKKWLNICYFLVLAGTLQAVITPDLEYGPYHPDYLIYFLMHVTLVFLPLYAIFVYRITPLFKDLVNAIIVANLYLLFTLAINYILDSNYFYSRHKPPNGSLLDYFGEWPYYLFVTEAVGIIFFLLLYLPFYLRKEKI